MWRPFILRACLMLLLVPGTQVPAQSPALPLFAYGKNEVSLSIQATRVMDYFQNDRHVYSGVIGRPAFTWNQKGELYAIWGLSRYSIQYANPDQPDFRNRFHWIYGAGLTWYLPLARRWHLYVNAQVTFMKPAEKRKQAFDTRNTILIRIQQTTYQRFQLHSGGYVAYFFNRLKCFLGLAWQYRTLSRRVTVFLDQEGEVQQLNRTVSLYVRDRVLIPSLGFNLGLPDRHQFGLHVQGTGPDNLAISIGLSQTGLIDD